MLNEDILLEISKNLGEPRDLLDKRKNAFAIFKKMQMPSPKSENWKYTRMPNVDLSIFNLAKQNISFGIEEKAIKNGVVFCDMKTAIKKYWALVSKYLLSSSIMADEDKFTALHHSFWNEGVFIYVPKNITVTLKNMFEIQTEGCGFSRILIVIEENSSLDYYRELKSKECNLLCLKSSVMEIHAKQNSRLNVYDLQNYENNVINIENWKANLETNSGVNWFFGHFGGNVDRVKIDTLFFGEGSESTTYGCFLGEDKQQFDFTTNAFHLVKNTSCNILVRGVLGGASNSIYRGKIKIVTGAQKTNSYLANNSLIFGEGAISNSIPSLEIDANDVKASHGATLGRPDEEELFYMMARGLNKKEAEKLIILGFFSPITEKIKENGLKEKFEDIIEKKVIGVE